MLTLVVLRVKYGRRCRVRRLLLSLDQTTVICYRHHRPLINTYDRSTKNCVIIQGDVLWKEGSEGRGGTAGQDGQDDQLGWT